MSPQLSRLAEWVSRLVQIPSVSPAQAGPRAGTPGEARIAGEIEGWFEELGGETRREEVLPGRPNVYGVWRMGAERWLGVDVHTDTVGVEQMSGDPFSGHVAGGRVYGRGAVDTKATLGVVLALLEGLHERGERIGANLVVAATVDEEDGAQGAPAFAAWLRGRGIVLDQLVVAEPTRCGPVVAQKGAVRLEFRVQGAPAHSSQPHLGRNAVAAAARITVALEQEHHRVSALPPHPLVGAPALTVTRIQGGSGANVVPDRCSLVIDRRLTPDENADDVRGGLADLARAASPLPFEVELLKQIPPFSQSAETPWIRQLAEWSGREPAGVPYGTNAWAYDGVARERVVLGPGSIDQAHGAEEWVEIAELEKLAEIYRRWVGIAG